jgi:hypothetical protein
MKSMIMTLFLLISEALLISPALVLTRVGIIPPRCLDDILRCRVYDTFAMAYHELS